MPLVPYQPGLFYQTLAVNQDLREYLTEEKSQEILDMAKRYQSYGVCGGDGKAHKPQDCWMVRDICEKVGDAIIGNAKLTDTEKQAVLSTLDLEAPSKPKKLPSAPPEEEKKELHHGRRIKPLEIFRLQGLPDGPRCYLEALSSAVRGLQELWQYRLLHKNVNPSVIVWEKGKNAEVQGYIIDYDLHRRLQPSPPFFSPPRVLALLLTTLVDLIFDNSERAGEDHKPTGVVAPRLRLVELVFPSWW
ncbi:hypothetical protein FRB94_004530 [Tulasnella sp. JGI-2019a]|nr:hypothetical protein FRB93_003170 [Tulasnella sp. JGI-2019a]KAG9001815.1 hypothetical protein FRB94_004530 [Tulasnella sp. JGI-2019a]